MDVDTNTDLIGAVAVADSLLEPVFAVEDGTVRYANRRFVEVFQLDPIGPDGVPLESFERHVEGGLEAFTEAIAAVAAGRADERRVELEMRHPSAAPAADELPAEARLTPLTGEAEKGAVVVALRDISERRERERALERQRGRLEEFASVVSHDLRNPLNVAQGSLELVRKEHDSDRLARVARAHDRMAELIEELLALGRVGGLTLELEPVALDTVARDGWRTVETDEGTLAVETSAMIRAHPSRLRQLVENLIRNAVQHAGPSVTVTIGELPDGFYVEDDGPGIDPDRRESVLEPGVSSDPDGTGFGLPIVTAVAEAHGWSVEVTGAATGGARFEFRGVEFAG